MSVAAEFSAFFRSPTFWSPLLAWILAQLTKMAINYQATRRLDFRYMSSLGGMPSAHSATVSALATSVGIISGFDSQVFMSTFVIAMIVMADASTVRRAAGLQATLLNDIVRELFKEHHFSQRKLVELLGHTRLEVFVGLLLGVLVAVVMNRLIG